MSHLKTKTAIVTGGSRGIGRAICLRLAEDGADVAFNYAKNADAAKELEEDIRSKGRKVSSQQVDVRDFDAVKSWVDSVKKEFGGLDILVNNAGITRDKALMMMSREEWTDVVDTNLNGTFNVTRSCIVHFMKQKKGHVINISSVSGVIGLKGQTNYSATKGGMNAFTKALAKEVAQFGVRVNAVAPGFIETDILSGFTDEQKKDIIDMIPAQRIGRPEEVAACVSYLLGGGAQYITGQVVHVDGGLAMK